MGSRSNVSIELELLREQYSSLLELLKIEMHKNEELQNTVFRYVGVLPKDPEPPPTFVDTNTAIRSWTKMKGRLEEMTRRRASERSWEDKDASEVS